MVIDVFAPEQKTAAPVAIFLPGFKGFKDWGFFARMHDVFTKEGIALITVNFSHNGTTPQAPLEFADLEAFAENTISLELSEVKQVVEWAILHAAEFGWDPGNINLIGHSRGGAEAIVYASGDNRINRVVAWAPVSEFGSMFKNADLEKWKSEGRIFIPNARTGQEMPLNYSLWDDLKQNADELDILKAASNLEMPMMLIHGDADESVPPSHSDKIYDQCLHAVLIPVPGGTHTFNTAHPLAADAKFPFQLQEVLVNTVEFIAD